MATAARPRGWALRALLVAGQGCRCRASSREPGLEVDGPERLFHGLDPEEGSRPCCGHGVSLCPEFLN